MADPQKLRSRASTVDIKNNPLTIGSSRPSASSATNTSDKKGRVNGPPLVTDILIDDTYTLPPLPLLPPPPPPPPPLITSGTAIDI